MVSLSALGCTPAKIKQFQHKNIFTAEDLISFLPKRYFDFRVQKTPDTVFDKEITSMIGTLTKMSSKTTSTGLPLLTLTLQEQQSHKYFYVNYFHSDYLADRMHIGDVLFFGGQVRVTYFGNRRSVSFTNPQFFSEYPETMQKLIPDYKKIPGMSSSYYTDTLHKALHYAYKKEYLEPVIIKQLNMIRSETVPLFIHTPKTPEDIRKAHIRMAFDDLFFFNFMLKHQQSISDTDDKTPVLFHSHSVFDSYRKSLPFELTPDQKAAVNQIYKTGAEGKRINMLLQGDVGYGKTEIAKALALFTAESHAQTVILAPTVVLARQHYEDFSSSFKDLGIHVVFLSQELKKKEKNAVLKQIKSGEADVIIGTHAVFSKDVQYYNLGSLVIDEEHRFGVEQREELIQKAGHGIHRLSMSATPIPRTLALSMYGDSIDVVELRTAPPHKKPVTTMLVSDFSEISPEVFKTLQAGHQCYVVCPLIQSDTEKTAELMSVEETSAQYRSTFEPYGYSVGCITGKMKASETADVLQQFTEGKINILIATTIIEVGVNVKNATLMIINNAERYGLAQLHQLRGRVGRGAAAGECILYYSGKDEDVLDRLKFLCSNTNGFEIAKKDMERRGVGNFIGTVQSGDNKYFSLILSCPKLNTYIKKLVNEIYKDPVRRDYYLRQLDERFENESSQEQKEVK